MRKKKELYEDLALEDLENLEEVKDFKIDKEAFKGPFFCCGKKTKEVKTLLELRNKVTFGYNVYECQKCKKQYIDSEQAEIFEKILFLSQEQDIIFHRKINFDGHNFFMRFPKEVTNSWKKGMSANIIPVRNREFLVKIE